MPIPEPPADLIQLRRAFLAAEAHHVEVCAQTPAGAEADEQHKVQEMASFAAMRDLSLLIFVHPWWRTAGNRVEAEKALRDFVRDGRQAS